MSESPESSNQRTNSLHSDGETSHDGHTHHENQANSPGDNTVVQNNPGQTQPSNVMNEVLDSVLENIDGLLMDHIPANPDLAALPPIPSHPATEGDYAQPLPAAQPIQHHLHHHQHDINISIQSTHTQPMYMRPPVLLTTSPSPAHSANNDHVNSNQSMMLQALRRRQQDANHASQLLIGCATPSMQALQQQTMYGQASVHQQPSEVEEVIQRQYQLAQQIHHTFNHYKRQFPRPHNQSINTIDENQTGLQTATASQPPCPLHQLPPLPQPSHSHQLQQPHSHSHNHSQHHMTPSSSHQSLVSLASNHSAATSKSGHSRGSLHHAQDDNDSTKDADEQSHDDMRRSNVLFCGQSTKITLFTGNDRVQLKDYVFISKDCTSRLATYIVQETWGKDHGLLYKYLDYIFRCQAFRKQTIVVNGKYLIFHSGLQRRSDKQFLFCLLNTNNKKYVTQKWRVPFGNIKNSFVSKNELLSKLPESYLLTDYLPKRTRFFSDLSQLLYDDTYSIEVNWEERLTTNKDRICRVLGNVAFFDGKGKFMRLTELTEAFEKSLKHTQRIAELNPRLAVAQGFIDTKHSNYRMELLLPLIIEFPKCSSTFYIFALAISKSPDLDKKYIGKSILTMNMAYANARLVGYVDSSWLFYGDQNNARCDINDFFSGRR